MAVNLKKGQKISLSKEKTGLSKVIVGLGWDEATRNAKAIDCDAFAILLQNGKLVDKKDLIYFGNKKHKTGAVVHMGDNLTGKGDGDDEQIIIDLSTVPAIYDRIIFAANIYRCRERGQSFGMINRAFIRLVDASTKTEVCIYNLTDNYSGSTALLFGEIYRHNNEWKFNAVGQGTTDKSISEFTRRYL